jgi:hypothetical protein
VIAFSFKPGFTVDLDGSRGRGNGGSWIPFCRKNISTNNKNLNKTKSKKTMKKNHLLGKALAAASLFAASSVLATTWYISPSGSDSHSGSQSSPWRTIEKAQSAGSSGDTVICRGGTYNDSTVNSSDSTYNYVHTITKGMTFSAYSGETPVFNFSGTSTSKRPCAFNIKANSTFTGITVTGTPAGTQKLAINFYITGSSVTCTFNNCVAHDSQAIGFYFENHSKGTCNNCDAYNNQGTGNSVGNTDGFGAHGNGVTFSHCRSWSNSDDGYDCINSTGANTYDHCWSYNNGVGGGDGNGFKIGGWGCSGDTPPSPLPVHTVKYCLSAENHSHGFYANHQPGQSANWTYNTSYKNSSADFDMLEGTGTDSSNCSVAGTKEVMHYNLACGGTLTADLNESGSIVSNNTWTSGITPADSDFTSTDASQITNARSGGNQPTITFMHPKSGNHCVGYGCF